MSEARQRSLALLDRLLQAEVAAAEAYAQAIRRLEGQPPAGELRALREDHVEAIVRLHRHAAPRSEVRSSAPSASATDGDGCANPASILRDLKRAEQAARDACQRALDHESLDPEVRRLLVGTVLGRQANHLRRLDELAGRES
jgi:hypothetical protein